jgi:MATE family multidrug resistance protein
MNKNRAHREILVLALPNILSNISVPLLSSVDTALVGFLSEMHLAAVGIGSMLFNFIYWNFGFLRMGTTGITAQAWGSENKGLQANTLMRALLISLFLSGLLLLLKPLLVAGGFKLMQVAPEQTNLVLTYFSIRIWAAPATLGLYVCMGWFFGMQNAWYPLYLTILVNCINIGVSYYAVQQLELGIAGVAWGTVCAQYFGFITALALIGGKYKTLLKQIRWSAIMERIALLRFLQINKDIFTRTFCLTLVFGAFSSYSSALGVTLLAVNTILLQYVNWFSFAVDGFAYAAESIVGKYKGAKDTEGVDQAIYLSFFWGGIMALFFSALYLFGGNDLLRLFTNQTQVIETASSYIWWVVLLPILGMPCYIWDGIYVGLTAVKSMRNSMLIAMLSFFVILFLGPFVNFEGIHLIWTALMTFLVVRGLTQWWLFRKRGADLI